MERIIIVLHGSSKNDRNNLENFIKELAKKLKRKTEDIKYAYLQFGTPTLEDIVLQCIRENVKRMIIHPLFLSYGTHVSSNIPEIIEKFRKNYPDIDIVYTKPIGLHKKLADIVKERINEINKF